MIEQESQSSFIFPMKELVTDDELNFKTKGMMNFGYKNKYTSICSYKYYAHSPISNNNLILSEKVFLLSQSTSVVVLWTVSIY